MRIEMGIAVMVCACTLGLALAETEMSRHRWIQAMRSCIGTMRRRIRYEQPPLAELLDVSCGRMSGQQRQLAAIMRRCAGQMRARPGASLTDVYRACVQEAPSYAVLSDADRQSFEQVIESLGKLELREQIRVLDEADERLLERERVVRSECDRRAKLIRALSVTGGAALFLLMV